MVAGTLIAKLLSGSVEREHAEPRGAIKHQLSSDGVWSQTESCSPVKTCTSGEPALLQPRHGQTRRCAPFSVFSVFSQVHSPVTNEDSIALIFA